MQKRANQKQYFSVPHIEIDFVCHRNNYKSQISARVTNIHIDVPNVIDYRSYEQLQILLPHL